MMTPEIEKVLASPSVHNLTKQILRDAMTKDCVDVVYDVELAAKLLRERMNLILGLPR